nr:methyl-accepting chemotaxis protein [Pseudomonas putida]
MRISSMTIKSKITLLASLCLIAVVALLVSLSLYRSDLSTADVMASSSQMLAEAAEQKLQAEGKFQALQIQKSFMRTYEYGEGVARFLLDLRERAARGEITHSALRTQLSAVLRTSLEKRPELHGLFVIFEPNALDGHDIDFVGQEAMGSNELGRFAQYWVHQKNGTLQAMLGDEKLLADISPGPGGSPFNTFFTCSRVSHKLCVLDPYFDGTTDDRELVTSITFPLIENGHIIAVLGLDVSLNSLQRNAVADSRKLYGGEGQISILSPSGLIAGNSQDASKLGSALQQMQPDKAQEILQRLGQTQSHTFKDSRHITVLEPLEPIAGSKAWGVLLSVPQKVLLAPVDVLRAELDAARLRGSVLELGSGTLAAVFGILLIWLTARGVTRPLLSLAAMLEDIAEGEGDLTRRLSYSRLDELGRLAHAFNRFLDKLQPVIAQVQGSVQDARQTADQSAQIARLTSEGMQQQFGRIDQVATALHEMSAAASASANSAAQACEAAGYADQASKQGLEVIFQTTTAIDALAEDLNLAMQKLENLAKSSDQIGSVLEVICAIAGQTNLLALNAAIEAARAGEAGRGFAVVADEVRNLARRTQDSVEEIRQVIENLQSGTRDVSQAMHSSHDLAQHNVVQAQQAANALERIGEAVILITEMNLQIASAAEEQSSVAAEINRNVEAIRDVTESLSGQAQQSAQVSEQLNELADYQGGVMQQFRV